MEPQLKCGTNWQPAAHIFWSCLCDLSQQNLHLNFHNKQVHTFKVKFWGQIRAQLFSPLYLQFCHLQYKKEYSWVMGIQDSVWYRQMYSTGRRIETGNLKQQHQKMLWVCEQKEENMSLKLFESDEFLVLCWSLADHNIHVTESAVLIPAKKSGEKSWQLFEGTSFCVTKFHANKNASKDG